LTSGKIDTDYIDFMWPVWAFCEFHNKTMALFPWLQYTGICRWGAQLGRNVILDWLQLKY